MQGRWAGQCVCVALLGCLVWWAEAKVGPAGTNLKNHVCPSCQGSWTHLWASAALCWATWIAWRVAVVWSLRTRAQREAKHGMEHQGDLADCKPVLRANMDMQMYPKLSQGVWLQTTSLGAQRHRLCSSGLWPFVQPAGGQGAHGRLYLPRDGGTHQVTKANSTFEERFRGSSKPLNTRSNAGTLYLWYLHSPTVAPPEHLKLLLCSGCCRGLVMRDKFCHAPFGNSDQRHRGHIFGFS